MFECFAYYNEISRKIQQNSVLDFWAGVDKAGAYGVQEWIGFIGVENISGSYYNIMGLPVQRLYRELLEV